MTEEIFKDIILGAYIRIMHESELPDMETIGKAIQLSERIAQIVKTHLNPIFS